MFATIFFIIGLFFGGLPGAFLGGFIGFIFDAFSSRKAFKRQSQQRAEAQKQYYSSILQFEDELLVLIAYVAKSDNNRLRQSELDYCKSYFQKTFPHSDITKLMLLFKDYLDDPDIAQKCSEACGSVRNYATIHEKLTFLQCLFGFAMADGNPHQSELNAIQNISDMFGVDRSTFEALKMMFVGFSYGGYSSQSSGSGGYYSGNSNTFEQRSGPTLDECYKILEVSPDASDDEVKKAYRAAAMKHHPDKVSHLGEDVRKQAEEKFAKINQAYDKIKAARGL